MHKLYLAHTHILDSTALEAVDYAAQAKDKGAGYAGVGLRFHPSPGLPYHPVVGDKPQIAAIRGALRAGGLELLDALSFYLQPEGMKDSFVPALEVAADLGARYALVQGDDPDEERLTDTFARFCQACRPLGITATIEPMPLRALKTPADAMRLIEKSGAVNAGILIDPLHLARAGCGPAEVRAIDPKWLPYAQISDGMTGSWERRMPGEGNLALREIIAALPRDIGLGVEVPIMKSSGIEPYGWCRDGFVKSRDWLAANA